MILGMISPLGILLIAMVIGIPVYLLTKRNNHR